MDLSLIDFSWRLNIPWRLHLGEIAGRDFVYTYGPLYQLIHALGLLVPPGDGASVYRYESVPESILVAASIWALLSFSGAALRWRSILYLGWCLYLAPVEHLFLGLRPHGIWLVMALCGYGAVCRPNPGKRTLVPFLTWALAVPVFLLYSFDSGVYGLAALLGLGISLLVVSRGDGESFRALRRRTVQLLFSLLAGMLGFVAVMKMLPGWGRYFRDSWDVASGYSAVMALGTDSFGLAAMLLSGLVLIGVIYWLSRQVRLNISENPAEARRAAAYLGVAWVALFTVRGGITRSDEAHVILACIPTIFLLCVVGPAYANHLGSRRWAAWLLAFLPFWALLPSRQQGETYHVGLIPFTSTAVSVVEKIAALPRFEFAPAKIAVDNAYIQDGIATISHTSSPSVLAWPNSAILNVILNKRSPDYTVQTYSAHTTALEEETIRNLEADPETVVYFPRYDMGLSGVQSCTRVPTMFRYMLEHYQVGYLSPSGSALLERRRAGREIHWREDPVDVAPLEIQPSTGQAATVRIRSGEALGRYGDFLVFYLRCPASPWLKLTKPGRMSIGFRMADGRNLFQRLALPADGQIHAILVSPRTVQDPAFLDVFAARPRVGTGQAVTLAGVIWEPLDFLSIRPPQVDLLKVTRLVPG